MSVQNISYNKVTYFHTAKPSQPYMAYYMHFTMPHIAISQPYMTYYMHFTMPHIAITSLSAYTRK